VWVGNDDNTPVYGASGGGFCAPVWARFMRRAIDALGCHGHFPQGAGVTAWRGSDVEEKSEEATYSICEESGGLATEECPNVKQVKRKKTDPKPKPCPLHGGATDQPPVGDEGRAEVTVCADSGLRATSNCPNTETREFLAGEAPGIACPIHRRGADTEPGGEPQPPTKAPPEPPPTPPRVPVEPPTVPTTPADGGPLPSTGD
jgi:membrane peptidoglycan carboxypeptidase